LISSLIIDFHIITTLAWQLSYCAHTHYITMLQPITTRSNLFPVSSGLALNSSACPGRENQETFSIHTLEWFLQQNKNIATQLRSYEILWIKKGKGTLTVDLRDMEVMANRVYLFRPGQFRHLEPGNGLEGYYLSVSSDFFHLSGFDGGISFGSANLQAFEGAVVVQTDEEVEMEAEEILVKMRREFMHYANTRTNILKGLFRIFMLYLSQSIENVASVESGCTEKELANKFMQLLQRHFTTKKFVSDYAGELCVTPGHLNRIVKKISGFPARHHIQQQVILEAKKQARYSNRSMKEIAYSLGFEDTAHFSKYFKNSSGMNFSNFKKLAD
jgi:AraC family transcriptional activator of pobA